MQEDGTQLTVVLLRRRGGWYGGCRRDRSLRSGGYGSDDVPAWRLVHSLVELLQWGSHRCWFVKLPIGIRLAGAVCDVALPLLQRCRWREKMKNRGELPWLLVREEED